jgi:hypothetical protein
MVKWFIFSWFIFVGHMYLKIYLSFSKVLVYKNINFQNDPLNFNDVVISPFSFLILLICIFFLFWLVLLNVCQFCFFFKESTFCRIDSLCFSFIHQFGNFCPDLHYFFLSNAFRFHCFLFFRSLRCISLFIQDL